MKIVEPKEFEELSPIFKGDFGNKLAAGIMHLLSIDRVNQVYENSEAWTGPDFTSRLLRDMGVRYAIGNPGNLEKLPDGAFITIANHPFGGLDGIILIDIFASLRSQYRLMVNKLLTKVKTLSDNFIPVVPAGTGPVGLSGTNIRAIRETLSNLKNGNPVGFFPSGAVSDLGLNSFRIRDRKWQAGIIHLIRSAKAPLVPVRFFDHNSVFFYLLGLINWRIRTLRLPYELFNKTGQVLRLGIGKIISVDEQQCFPDTEDFGLFLRKSVYGMPLPGEFIPAPAFKG